MGINELGNQEVACDALETAANAGVRVSCVPVPTALYRHFDSAGALLYVGISLNPFYRLSQHRDSASWFAAISRIEIEWLASREEALAAERVAIQTERPAHNIAHVDTAWARLERLIGAERMHMIDADGRLLDRYATLGPGEASAMARKLG